MSDTRGLNCKLQVKLLQERTCILVGDLIETSNDDTHTHTDMKRNNAPSDDCTLVTLTDSNSKLDKK